MLSPITPLSAITPTSFRVAAQVLMVTSHGLCDLPQPHFPSLSLSLSLGSLPWITLFQAHWPPCYFSNSPGLISPLAGMFFSQVSAWLTPSPPQVFAQISSQLGIPCLPYFIYFPTLYMICLFVLFIAYFPSTPLAHMNSPGQGSWIGLVMY